MAEQKKVGQIKIFAKNIRGNANGGVLEESKFTRNFAGGRHVQNGTSGGVNNDVNNSRTEPLRVKKIEGPFDPETGRIVDIIDKEKKYNYKVTQFNRTPTETELKNLKWGIRYDDGSMAPASQVTGLKTISFYVSQNQNVTKVRVYAYFQKAIESVKVETYTVREEIIIIIGTEQYSDNSANKLMFPAQAVRLVREELNNYPFLKIALFIDGYSEKQLTAATNSLLNYNKKSTVIRVNSIDEVTNLISSGNRDSSSVDPKRKVKKIYAYAHGYVRKNTNEGVIAFGYEGKNASKQELDIKSFSQIKIGVFLEKNATTFYSYSCRTGIGTSAETTTNPEKNKSLAQNMANKGRITVYAYMRRSLYEDTWGTQNHRDTYASDNDAGDSSWEDFKTDIKDLGSSDPTDMQKFNIYRKKEVKINGAIWNPEGAYLGVKAGAWPKGVPTTFDKYNPN